MKYVIYEGLVHGRVFDQGQHGWRYMPFNSAQRSSRKGWPTPEAAIKGRTKGKIIEATTLADAQAKAKVAFEEDKRMVETEAKAATKPAAVEIEVCERLMDYGWLPHVEDGVYKGLRQVPKYHASIKGKKHWGCGMSRSEAIGSLIQSHPEMFNISVTHLQQKLPR